MAPARIGQTEMEQPVLQHLPDPQHTGPMLLQEHHLLGRTMQGPPLLDAALERALAPKPLLTRPELL